MIFLQKYFLELNLKKILRKNGTKGTRALIHRELSYTMFPKNSSKDCSIFEGGEGGSEEIGQFWFHFVKFVLPLR